MKTAAQWWNETAEDAAWIDNKAAIIERIQREAFAAGHAEGVETMARAIEGHAARLGSNIPLPMLPAIPRGLVALAGTARQLAVDPAVLEAAWRRAGAAKAGQDFEKLLRERMRFMELARQIEIEKGLEPGVLTDARRART